MAQFTVMALDPGPEVSGMVVLRYEGIVEARNLENGLLFNIMLEYDTPNVPLIVLIEDVAAYGTRLSGDLIRTCKWIGKLEYWLESRNIAYKLIFRSTVRKWVFDSYPEISIPRIEQEIIRLDRRRKDGEYCKPHARYVDDRIVEAAMRQAWQIQKPKPGKSNVYGLTKHSYQALALGCSFLNLKNPTLGMHASTVKHVFEAIKASASSRGRQRGLKGGKARAEKLSPERRKEIAQKAAKARWSQIK